jgi:hypothetical protein
MAVFNLPKVGQAVPPANRHSIRLAAVVVAPMAALDRWCRQ